MDGAGVWEEQAVSKATRPVPSARVGCAEGAPKGLGSWLLARVTAVTQVTGGIYL